MYTLADFLLVVLGACVLIFSLANLLGNYCPTQPDPTPMCQVTR